MCVKKPAIENDGGLAVSKGTITTNPKMPLG